MSTSAEPEIENSASADPVTPVSRAGRGTQLAMLSLRGRTLIVLIVLVIMFGLISGDYLTTSNLLLMSEHVSITGLMAIGVTFVILTGGIDLSVGSVAGLAGMIAGGLLYEGLKLPGGDTLWFSTVMVIALAILAGAVVGLINGLLVTKLKVAPFIATLGVLYAARGLADLRSNGATFPNLAGSPARHDTGFSTLGIKSWLGVPVAIWIMVLVAAVAVRITTRTPFGRRVYAVGGNERAAELAGIRTSRVKIAAYVISGACAALAGLILTSELGAAYPDSATTYELNAIAAAVLGGTSLTGVKGTVIVLAVVMEQTQERVKTRLTT
ncbi:ABC transporter permease [Actinoallomurus sp. CA-142502]|uniref:ABC transporter permease n=1 Tax=Actinoallomurus sp. CA-142502 TaxID=3239885 RepID=UPI003D8C478A